MLPITSRLRSGLLLVLCWPLALLRLVRGTFLELLSLPLPIMGALMEAILVLVKAIMFLPTRRLRFHAS